jgi:hypothetical protein
MPQTYEADPSPESVPPTSPWDAINEAVPLHQRKMTIAAWLDQLPPSWSSAATGRGRGCDSCDGVCKAGRTLTDEARARLRELIDAALTRHSNADDADAEMLLP